jgi:hypothetical protein
VGLLYTNDAFSQGDYAISTDNMSTWPEIGGGIFDLLGEQKIAEHLGFIDI